MSHFLAQPSDFLEGNYIFIGRIETSVETESDFYTLVKDNEIANLNNIQHAGIVQAKISCLKKEDVRCSLSDLKNCGRKTPSSNYKLCIRSIFNDGTALQSFKISFPLRLSFVNEHTISRRQYC